MYNLETRYGLQRTRNVDFTKMLGIILHILGYGLSNMLSRERFQCCGETIIKYLSLILEKACAMGKDFIQPTD